MCTGTSLLYVKFDVSSALKILVKVLWVVVLRSVVVGTNVSEDCAASFLVL
jgi:hypothetical protein